MTIGIQQLMFEVERVRDAFHAAVFSAADLDAALAVTAEDCELVNLPMGTGASARGPTELPRRRCPPASAR